MMRSDHFTLIYNNIFQFTPDFLNIIYEFYKNIALF